MHVMFLIARENVSLEKLTTRQQVFVALTRRGREEFELGRRQEFQWP
ncbi:hypothetical protein HMPREF3227_00575 [Corynebacterium sp. CMW7794]|nr:hypothetical protein HMPREF0307_01285 [Corynebacterium sp. DNF00584]KXI19559.1 hypothetical protein HMPREF3227_00575 [Corynebacterium sp. CMW7794]